MGYAGLLAAFAAMLLLTGCFEGPQGPPGTRGPEGAVGSAGPRGPAGPQGAAGALGVLGPAGPAGPPGATGPAGASAPSNLRLVQDSGDAIACNDGEVLVSALCNEGGVPTVSQNRSAKCATPGGAVGLCMRR
jgi:hypothetical protein